MEMVNDQSPAETVNHPIPVDVVEWLNEKALAAKQRDDYECFEYWRRAYLNAQAARRRERRTGAGDKIQRA